MRFGAPRRLVTALGVGWLAVLVLTPATAQADCVGWTPRDAIRVTSAAFIGRFVERLPDGRLVYVVDQRVKGELGATVTVRDEAYPGFSSLGNLGSTPGQEYALTLRAEADGFSANGCNHLPPAAMRVAAASGLTRCPRPVVTTMTTRVARGALWLRLDLRLESDEAFPSGARIEWGDGDELDVALLRSAAHTRTLTRTHNYALPGRYRVRVVARARPAAVDCFGAGVTQRPTYGSRARPVRVG